MGTGHQALDDLLREAAEAVQAATTATSARAALPELTQAQELLGRAVDEAMAATVLEEGTSLRQAGHLASLSENAVGPRLARTARLAPYASPEGRITRSSVERARYDAELGRPAPAPEQPPQPLRFRRRRDT